MFWQLQLGSWQNVEAFDRNCLRSSQPVKDYTIICGEYPETDGTITMAGEGVILEKWHSIHEIIHVLLVDDWPQFSILTLQHTLWLDLICIN